MKVIILAAGKGTRLQPLTDTTPKPLFQVCGKTIIEHNLEHIFQDIDECIIVTKYLSEKFPEGLGDNYKGVPLRYETQNENSGTAAALQGLEISPDEEVLIFNGDDIYMKDDLQKLMSSSGYATLCYKVPNPEIYGIFKCDDEGKVLQVVEKPTEFIGDLANMGAYKLPGRVCELAKNIPLSPRSEYEFTDVLNHICQEEEVHAIESSEGFISIGYPWNLLDANAYFLGDLKQDDIKGIIEDNVHINGKVILEEGAVIKSGTYIEGNCYFGKNSVVGPNAYVRGNTSLGEGGKIGFSVEVKNSYIGKNSKIPHLSYLGDSILGNNVNLGCGFKVANLRHDGKNMRVMVKGELVDSGKRKLGCIIGDNVKTGINTLVYPGRVLPTGSATLPGETVK